MQIEQTPYVADIHVERVPNKHELVRVHYTIVKRGSAHPLLIDGFAATWIEAHELVRLYLMRFAERDKRDIREDMAANRGFSSVIASTTGLEPGRR